MSTKVKTKTTDAAASAARNATVPETADVAFSGADARPDAAPKRQAKKLADLRSRPALLTVPIVLVSTLAIGLNLSAPAQAQALAKKPLKSKLAETTPVLAVTSVATAVQVAPTQYSVVDGDTVSGIAARFGLSTAAVLAGNGLDSRALIFPGQVLTLTQAAAPVALVAAPAVSASSYSVQSGDTISGIAAAHGLKTADVLGANGLTGASVIHPGQVLVLAAAAAMEPAAYVAPVAEIAAAVTHTIASGETITAVANAAGVSVQAMLDANGLGWSSIIYPGQVLTLPITVVPASVAVTVPVATAGVVTPMSEEMRQNAQTIVSVGQGAGVSRAGLVVALAAAAQESGLRNVDYGDRDSLGLFQQRPSAGWGTPEQVMDPVRASLAFFGGASNPNPNVTRGLLDIAGWESMTVTQAAQAVQISAYPDYYAKWETSAQAWLSQLG
ncbi:lytic transglycosylase [Cryobacterium aureum]|uniref:lytic transglycosylase n=1 Tax=Cryobacterium aureum TaxID=995037 RepID=UPI000CF44F9E|nr:LysM peptidoglycan-binding domain-containing protein [Cryobacterium aureum]